MAKFIRLPFFVFCPLLFRFDDAVRLLDFVRGVVVSQPLGAIGMQANGAVRQGAKMRIQGRHGLRLGVSASEEQLAHHVIRRFNRGIGVVCEYAAMPTEDTARPPVEVAHPPCVRCARCELRILQEAT